MKILIAPDAFKDALPALAVCEAIVSGLRLALPKAECISFPLADGGEGTAEILTYHSQGNWETCTVQDPLFRPVKAAFGRSADGETAFLDMAQASGLQLLEYGERNPLKTTTYGTGELLRKAIKKGARRIILGIGGSATNDGGMGMAAALGYRFLDREGAVLPPVGASLESLAAIDDSKVISGLSEIEFVVLCDVDNPLFGPRGAAVIYGKQKGADQHAIHRLDRGLAHYAKVLQAEKLAREAGAGAAGGMGFAGLFFLNAQLQPGIETVLDLSGFDELLSTVDLVITGEGRIDEQTLQGKLIAGLARRTARQNVPLIAFCGALDANIDQLQSMGLHSAFSIQTEPVDLPTALRQTARNLKLTAFNVGQLLRT